MYSLIAILPAASLTVFVTLVHLWGLADPRLHPASLGLVLASLSGLWGKARLGRASALDFAMAVHLILGWSALWTNIGGAPRLVLLHPEASLYALFLLFVALPLILGREPFTTVFARRRAPQAVWETDIFKLINRNMSWAWAGIFAACLACASLPILLPLPGLPAPWPDLILGTGLPLVLLLGLGLPFTRRYPDYYLRRLGLEPGGAPASQAAPAAPDASATHTPEQAMSAVASTDKTIVAINASPHAAIGNCGMMLNMLKPVLEEEGYALEVINLQELEVRYCVGCGFCMEKGSCWIADDHAQAVAKLLAAPAVILASPVFFGNVTGQMKTFLDRSLAWGHKPRAGWKPGLVVSVSAGWGETEVAAYLSSMLRVYGAYAVGQLTCLAVGPGEFMGEEQLRLKAGDLARDLARHLRDPRRRPPASDQDLNFWLFMGHLIKSQQEGLMADDHAHWERQGLYKSFEDYVGQRARQVSQDDSLRQAWLQGLMAEQKQALKAKRAARPEAAPMDEAAQALGETPRPPQGPQEAATCLDLLRMMPLGFDPEAAQGLEARIQFVVSGEENFIAHLEIAQGRCRFVEGAAASPSLTIQTPAQVWLAIAQGRLNGAAAFMSGKYQAQGDMGLLLKLQTLFSKRG